MPIRKSISVSTYVSTELYEFLVEQAKKEKRTLSSFLKNLLSTYMDKIKQEEESAQQEAQNIAVPGYVLWLLSQDQRPSNEQILEAAAMCGIDEEKLLKMRDRLFPNGNGQTHKEDITNGH